jgi:N-acetylneuraminic acid mutarotase
MKGTMALILTLGLVSLSLAIEDTWTYKTDMPTARVFAGGCVVDGRIYVIGGAPSASSTTQAVEMYDPIADTWTRKANMPSGRCYPATCTFDGKIYVFGGTSPDMWSGAKKSVYVYDPIADSWAQKADMAYANAGFGVAVVGDTIYLIGGNSIALGQTVMAYNPVTESWTQKTDMPTARYGLSACVVDGKIYATGGTTETWNTFTHVEVYDPSTDTWSRKSDMPTQRWGLGTCVVDGKIFSIGGSSTFSASRASTEVYDPVTDIWTVKSSMQQKRYGLFVGSVGDKIYAIGGSVPGILSTVEEYDTGFTITAPPPDFNGDGIVDINDLLRLIESWGQDDPLVDIAPPFGDGVIDVLDLEVLMSFWGQEADDPTLLAHWALDEVEGIVAHDGAGVNDAAVIGTPVWHPAGGIVDGALELDGTTCVVAEEVLGPGEGLFSVLAWIKGGAPGQTIVSQADGVNWLMIDAVEGTLATEPVPPKQQVTVPPLISDATVTDNAWHRVVFVRDGASRNLYVDGTLVATDEQNNLAGSDGGLFIGCGADQSPDSFFCGLIDDVRIYNRAVRP